MSHSANCQHGIICQCKGCEDKNDLGFLVIMVGGVKNMTKKNPHHYSKVLVMVLGGLVC